MANNIPETITPDKSYEIRAKRPDTEKWWGFGRLSVNQWGNWGIGMKVTDELLRLLEAKKGQYVNFSVFERDRKQEQQQRRESTPDLGGDTIPF